jgi:LTXXQ motif family protein
MKTMSRGLALALLIGVSPVAVLVAQAARDGGWKMSPEARERLQEGKIASAKATLKLTAEQEKLWAPIEEQVRTMYKERAEKRAERQKGREERRAERDKDGDKAGDQKSAETRQRPNVAERYERIAKRMSERADKMKAFSSAFSPFYASLTDQQKEVIGPAMRELRVAQLGGGQRGWGHRGGGWHDGGWGKRWGGHHDRGGDEGGPRGDGPGHGDAPDGGNDGAGGDAPAQE